MHEFRFTLLTSLLLATACSSSEHVPPRARPPQPIILANAPPPSPWSWPFGNVGLPSLCAPSGWGFPGMFPNCPPADNAAGVLPPLSAPEGVVPLVVPGFGNAMVSLPLGTRRARPIIVVLHGSYDRPEWECDLWRGIVENRGFVLCPQGIPAALRNPKDEPRFTHGAELSDEIDTSMTALRVQYGPYVDPGPSIYAGFSLGAIRAPSIVLQSPQRFPRMILVEGGTNGWGEKKFAEGGGQRVLFACGQAGCASSATWLAERFNRVDVPARVAYGPGGGHNPGGVVADAIKIDWDWLVEGDSRWAR